MKAWKLYGCVFLAVGMLLQGCGSDSTSKKSMNENKPKDKVILTFYGNKVDANDVAVVEEILNEYMKLHPEVSITYESIKGKDYYTVLDKRLATGNGDDIFIVDHDHLQTYMKKGYLAKLNDVEGVKNFLPLATSQMTMEDGSIYYVPTTISSFGLFCNEDLLQKHNLKVPQNFAELKAACDAFTTQGKKPLIVNQDMSLGTLIIAGAWHEYYSQDKTKELYDAMNGKKQPVSKLLAQGITKAMELAPYIDSKKCAGFKKNKGEFPEFAKGEAAFMVTGNWNNIRLQKLKPAFNYSIHPYPIKDDGKILLTNVDVRMVVNANSKNKNLAEAKKFLSFFLKSDKMERFATSQSSFSPIKTNWEGKGLQDKHLAAVEEAYRKQNYMLGSDDEIKYPIWNKAFKAGNAILTGASRQQVERIFDEDVVKNK